MILSNVSKLVKQNFRRDKKLFCNLRMYSIVEMRTYEAYPDKTQEYLKLVSISSDIRKKYLGNEFKLFLGAETGYGTLSDFIHLYSYDNLDNRSKLRKSMNSDPEWKSFLETSRNCLKSQKSEIFVPAIIPNLNIKYFTHNINTNDPSAVYEIRHYQLRPGYDTIPIVLDIFSRGLPDKLAHCNNDTGSLILLAHSDISVLNQFIEIWRYPSPIASIKHREASRKALKWRESIADMAKITIEFKNRLMVPTSFSPLK